MIIVGYQGIGKSTLARRDYYYIDLESSAFLHNGRRPEDWHVYYCKAAELLSQQGHCVFVSSHEVVRRYLMDHSQQLVIAVAPSLALKSLWIRKLRTRWRNTGNEKDKRAYYNAVEHYAESIEGIKRDLPTLTIERMDYDLETVLGLKEGAKN